MHLSLRMAWACETCGREWDKPDDAVNQDDVIRVSCLVRTPPPETIVNVCPECGRAFLTETQGEREP